MKTYSVEVVLTYLGTGSVSRDNWEIRAKDAKTAADKAHGEASIWERNGFDVEIGTVKLVEGER